MPDPPRWGLWKIKQFARAGTLGNRKQDSDFIRRKGHRASIRTVTSWDVSPVCLGAEKQSVMHVLWWCDPPRSPPNGTHRAGRARRVPAQTTRTLTRRGRSATPANRSLAEPLTAKHHAIEIETHSWSQQTGDKRNKNYVRIPVLRWVSSRRKRAGGAGLTPFHRKDPVGESMNECF